MDKHTRRDVLRMGRQAMEAAGFAAASGSILASIFPLGWERYQNEANREALEEECATLKNAIIKKYSREGSPPLILQITSSEVEKFVEVYSGRKVEVTPIMSLYVERAALKNLAEELAMYPLTLIQNKIKQIVLMDKAQLRPGDSRGGFALPDERKALYVGVPALFRSHHAMLGRGLPRTSIHHELGHVFLGESEELEKQWVALHPGVEYFRILKRAYSDKRDKPPGFADAYGQQNYAEDMATVFERMVLEPSTFPQKTDPGDMILAAKVRFIKNLLRTVAPEMDDAYWERLAALNQ